MSRAYRIGDRVRLSIEGIDQADDADGDEERVTPIGSIWEVRDVPTGPANDMYQIVCYDTGGWIALTPAEMDEFSEVVS